MIPPSRMSQHVIPLLDSLKNKYGKLRILETGSIRDGNIRYATGDGWSTYWIAKWIKENGGVFMSLDLNTLPAAKFLVRHQLQNFVRLTSGNSLKLLPEIEGPLHLVLLDSANDASLILQEFQMVEAKAFTVVVDDVIMDSVDVVKGHRVVPYARTRYPVTIANRLAIIEVR